MLMLCKMTFQLSSKVVALHLDITIAKTCLCNEGGTASLFLSRLAYHSVNLVNRHGITPIQECIPTHLSVEADYLSQDQLVPK